MTLIASIITFPKKKKIGKKNVTLDPRHGTLALDMEPSTLDPGQKDRLVTETSSVLQAVRENQMFRGCSRFSSGYWVALDAKLW